MGNSVGANGMRPSNLYEAKQFLSKESLTKIFSQIMSSNSGSPDLRVGLDYNPVFENVIN